MNWNLMDEIFKIRKKLKLAQSKVQDMETLICVKLNKIYSPRQSQKIIKTALRKEDEVREEWQIKMDDALCKANLMREEVDGLMQRVIQLEYSLGGGLQVSKKRRARFESAV